MAIETAPPPGRRQEAGDAAIDGIHRPSVCVSWGMNLHLVSGSGFKVNNQRWHAPPV